MILYTNEILDFETFFKFHNETFETIWNEMSPLPYKPNVKMIKDLYDSQALRCYFVIENNERIGYVAARIQDHLYTSERLFTIDSLHIHADKNNPKVLRKLLNDIKREADQFNCKYVIITVPYAKMGMGRDRIHSIRVG